LSREGLTITQYALLANIERAGQLSHAVLAEKVGMERTTLTRNLRPLTRAKWVVSATGQDRRQHLLQLSAAGRRKLVRSLPLWEEAQRQFRLGPLRWTPQSAMKIRLNLVKLLGMNILKRRPSRSETKNLRDEVSDLLEVLDEREHKIIFHRSD
jgi:DNA-binding MarR family transcriptional regulator